MLSYQHAYHAGALADVHKHAALALVLNYLTRKDKPLTYLETHAGRGIYDLGSPEAQKTGEAARGIARAEELFAPDHPYRGVLDKVRSRYGASAYPGSPLIAALMLRPEDRLHLAELHPQEHQALADLLSGFKAEVRKQDGLVMGREKTPPQPRRGLMLIDPSFEVKSDYTLMPRFLAEMNKRWNVGILMLWYPILSGGQHAGMAEALDAAALPGALHHQLTFPPAKAGHGMVGSGLFFVNAPFGLSDELDALTARLSPLAAGPDPENGASQSRQ